MLKPSNISSFFLIIGFNFEFLWTFLKEREKNWHRAKTGEMSEWFKEHAWKVCVLQKGTEGSNPSLSAIN